MHDRQVTWSKEAGARTETRTDLRGEEQGPELKRIRVSVN